MSEGPISGSILLVGPDGAGKTALADAISRALAEREVAVARAHFRPGILMNRGRGGSVVDPHGDPPRGIVPSLAKLALIFADHVLGALTVWRRARKGGVLLVERGWHDMAVDPDRYRLPKQLARIVVALGRVLKRHDLTVVCDGPSEILFDRKPELDVPEIERQRARWATIAPATAHEVMVVQTVGRSPDEVAACVVGRWEHAPPARWIRTPIAPSRLGLSLQCTRGSIPSLQIYRPHRLHARALARVNAKLAGWRVGRTVDEPVPRLSDLVREIGVTYDGAAAFKSSAAGRHIIGLANAGALRYVLKVGSLEDQGLAREGDALERLGGAPEAVRVPSLIWRGEWRGNRVVVTAALPNASRATLSPFEVADLCTVLCAGVGGQPLVHGDLAPWNLLSGADGTYLLDWENYRRCFEPLYDLLHYIVRSGALLGWFSPREAARLLLARSSPGWLHLEAVGVDPMSARQLATEYLRRPATTTAIDQYQKQVIRCMAE